MKSQSFAKDTLITATANVGRLVVGLAVSVVLARGLGPVSKGIYALAVLFPSLIITFINLGIGPATVYLVAKGKYPLNEILGNNIILSIGLALVGISAGVLIAVFFGDSLFPEVNRDFLLIALFYVPLGLFIQQTGSQMLLGMREIKRYNMILFSSELSFLPFLLVLIIAVNAGVTGAILAKMASSLAVCILLYIWSKKAAGSISFRINKDYIRELFSYGSKAYTGNVLGFLNYRVEIFLLGILMPASEIGFYSVSVGSAEKLWILSRSAATVIFPVISAEKDEKKIKSFTPFVCRTVLYSTTLVAVVLAVIARWAIVLLYSEAYSPSANLLRFLLPGIVLLSSSRILSNDIAGRGKPLLNTYVGIFGLIVQVTLNLLLIPSRGAAGAALATSIAYAFLFISRVVVYSVVSKNAISTLFLPRRSDWIIYSQVMKTAIGKAKAMITSMRGNDSGSRR